MATKNNMGKEVKICPVPLIGYRGVRILSGKLLSKTNLS